LLAGGKNTQGKYMEGGVYYYYDYYFLGAQDRIDIIPQGLWILEHAIAYQGEA
jgi:hypothetical protein